MSHRQNAFIAQSSRIINSRFPIFFRNSNNFLLFRQSVPVEFHDGLSPHNGNIYDVITSQPTSQQHQPNSFVSFPVTLPSSIIHSPNYFISNKVFAKSVSTQTIPNFSGPLLSSGGRHCLSIIYQTEEEVTNLAKDEVAINVNLFFSNFETQMKIKFSEGWI